MELSEVRLVYLVNSRLASNTGWDPIQKKKKKERKKGGRKEKMEIKPFLKVKIVGLERWLSG